MTPGKDDFIFFETLKRTAYTPVPYSGERMVYVSDTLFDDIKQHLSNLSDIYTTTVKRNVLQEDRLVSTYLVFVPWEVESGEYIGTRMVLKFIRQADNQCVVDIDFVRHRQITSPFKSD